MNVTTLNRGLFALVISAVAGLLLACPEDDEDSEPRCIPGESRECACADGAKGRQLCESDGNSLAPCECQAVAASPAKTPAGATPAAPGAGTPPVPGAPGSTPDGGAATLPPSALPPLPPPPAAAAPVKLPPAPPAGPASAALGSAFQPDSNTLALWHFDDGTGTVAADAGALRLTTALRNATWGTGRFNGAVKLSGSGANVQATQNDGLFPENEITIEAWVRPEASASMSIYDVQDTHGLALRPRGTDVEAVFTLRVNDTVRTLVSTSPLPINQWHHVAGTFDGTNMRLFVNGTVAGELEAVGSLTRARLCDTPTIGSTCPASGGWFNGLIDEVRISNMARYVADGAAAGANPTKVAGAADAGPGSGDAGRSGTKVVRPVKAIRNLTKTGVQGAKRILGCDVSSNLFDLTGKVALVTGGNGGIGLGFALALAEAGADICIWGTREDKNAAALEKLAAHGRRVESLVCDVSDESAVESAFDRTLESLGRVDACFANAGVIGQAASCLDIGVDEWRRVLGVNLDGAFFTLRAAARHMVARAEAGDPGGRLVGTASLAALSGAARNEHYAATKGAVVSMIRAMAVEFARAGVTANAVLPGWIETDMTERIFGWDKFEKSVLPRIPARRWGRPADFAGIAVYLASDASAYHTGDSLLIDGGYWIF